MHRVMRRVGLDSNPMRRAVDRVEAWATLALLAALVFGGPALAWHVGQYVYRDAVVDAPGAQAEHFRTRAMVTEGPAEGPYTAYATIDAPPTLAGAVWTAPDQTVHSGQIPVPEGTAAGSTVILWTDATGEPVGPPPDRDRAAATGIVAGLLTAVAAIVFTSVLRGALLRAADRRRLSAWHDEWSTVGPRWTGHG
jgi:hypothetical protein